MSSATVIDRGLAVLRERIAAANLPSSKIDETLTVATWNIREFGRRPRRRASIFYIAEILRQFDLVSIVELRENLRDLDAVMNLLGSDWDAVYSDYITDPGGNRERLAFVFDKRMVRHTGLASQICAPRTSQNGEYLSALSWWRVPYMASFRAGATDVQLITAHIRWADKQADREPEIAMLSAWIDKRADARALRGSDLVVLGDFNIPSQRSPLYRTIQKHGLRIPKPLLGTHGSNLAKNKRYDQILHLPRRPRAFTGLGGCLDFYSGGIKSLYPRGIDAAAFTYELSDHLPLWAQMRTDAPAT